jgi:ATP-dependent RNA helicase SUPV3L1/SUV3
MKRGIFMKVLEDFYVEQYRGVCRQAGAKARMQKYQHKINAKVNQLRSTHASFGKEELVGQFHREVRRLAQAAYFSNNKEAIRTINGEILPELVRMDLELFSEQERELLENSLKEPDFLKKLSKEAYGEVCARPFAEVYRESLQRSLNRQIVELVPARPEMEFPKAREMNRHFILHIGPTNSGKTYHALERLKDAESGVYLGPLRLLALEVYERMKEYGTACTMLTGQECIEEPDSRVTASTVEMLDIEKEYEVAVIDEAQMVADELRGHSWTRAILGVRAREIHVCMSPDAEGVITHLIELGNGTYEVNRYERKTPLELMEEPISFPEDVQDGDALIVFSKKAVLNVAGRLEEHGIASSVIYGSLPPEIRRRQMHLFNTGKTKVVVSTDAIGMGLNLPVRRIVFMEVEKYDGVATRALELSEIRQIAGRAGRYGLYETGYVTAMDEQKLRFLQRQWKNEERPIERVSLGFPQILLSMDAPLDVVLKLWHDAKPSEPFEKIKIDEMLFLYNEAYRMRAYIADFDDKSVLYRMITCPVDIKDTEVVRLWSDYCMNYTADISLEKPRAFSKYQGLQKYESYYKKLDLYYQLSMRLGKLVDSEWLEKEREKTQDTIMQLLAKDKHEYILRCKYCGKILPVDSPFRVCAGCRREVDAQRPQHGNSRRRSGRGGGSAARPNSQGRSRRRH